jgi:2-dehydro-3-deoxygluconokinase
VTPLEAARFANAAAALATLDFGAQAAMPKRHDVERFLSSKDAMTGTRLLPGVN